MHIISKQGSVDNVLTYEHICDTSADMAKIDRKYITLGSTCIILAGQSGAMEVYMADSNKEWHDILAGASSSGNTPSGLMLHICTQNEVSNGNPNIEFPLETELYLVPSGAESGNLYDEYIWVNGAWELFGSANIDLTGYATQAWVSQQGYLSSFTETDPTVPAWAKAATKPTYTAVEVGALPADTQIPTVPTNISAFTNDANYLSNPEATTMVENWLESNITTGNVIDASLTIEGASADAKKTGDKISTLKSAISTVSNAVEFVKINDFDGNDGVKSNVIESPYTVSDMLDRSMILSNGTIATGASYATGMVSPLIPVNSGMYGLKVVHDTDYPDLGNIHSGNNYNNGFGFFAEDGETVVSRASRAQVLGNDIYVIEVPSNAKYIRFTILKNSSGSSYTKRALDYFNQWVFLPNADSTITDDFFDLGTPKENGEIEKILRKDGSYLEIKDKQARDAIAGMDVGEVSSFLDSIDIESSFTNLLNLPYAESDILKFSNILSSGRVRNERSEYDRTTSLTPLIPVVAGKYALYVPSGQGTTSKGQLSSVNNGYGLFSSDGETPVAKTGFASLGNGIFSIDVPEGTSYIRFVFFHGPANTGVFSDESVRQGLFYLNKNWALIKTDKTSLTPEDFAKRQNGSLQSIKRADGSRLMISPTTLPDQKILVFGDSIWGKDRLNGLADYLAEYSGATIYNCAIGGTRITGDRSTQDEGDSWRPFDGANLIHAKLENTWTEQDAHATEVASYVAGETLPLLKSVDMSSVNIVILAYGHNDFTGNKTISAIVAAYEQVITEILTAYPLIRILVCTSPWRSFSGEDADIHQNDNGDTLRQMDDAIIAMAKSKHVAVLDTLSEVPWNGLTKGVYLDDDETHPSTLGNMVYAHVVNGKLRSMF